MSRTLVYRTNKDFDKCTELLRNILSVQESRRYSKSSAMIEPNRKKQQQQQQQSSTNTQQKKQNSKITATKSCFVKSNIHNGTQIIERRSSYSPNKSLLSPNGVVAEEYSSLKNRLSPNKSRKCIARSPSPTQIIHQRVTSPSKNTKLSQKSSPSSSKPRRRVKTEEDLVRSSSCGDIPSSKSRLMHKEQRPFILDQFVTHLTRIRTISKQIQSRNTHIVNDPEYSHLWNELESSLSSALSDVNDDIQFQSSSIPLHCEIIELRKELQTTNVHLREYDLTRRNDVDLQKKFDANQIECTKVSLHNEQLKHKCRALQDKLDQLERNNTRFTQRLTQQDLRSIAQRTEWISTDNHFLLREEIIFLREKLYHVYDDLSNIFNRNHTLQNSIEEQKQFLLLYKQQLNYLKQSAHHLLHDLDNRSMEEKVKRFLNNILIDQYQNRTSTSPFHQTQTKAASSTVNPSVFRFETPYKQSVTPVPQPATSRSRISPAAITNKLRPKSLFVTPTVLNDSEALFKFQENRSPTTINVTSCSSSTIDDADSILTSSSSISLYYQQRKRSTLYNSLPTLTVPKTMDITKITRNEQMYNNESGPELDQISDLTSKMFSSGDEEDAGINDVNTSTSSSSTIPSDAERLMHL